MIEKHQRYVSRKFLAWAKTQAGPCCLCPSRDVVVGVARPGSELHHYGAHGLGAKCHDYEVARVCPSCHAAVQGKRRAYFVRTGAWEVLAAMQADALELLMAWAARHERHEE